MDQEKLREKLIAAARSNPPSDSVPYAFETRIMARLKAVAAPNAWMLWGQALWRAAAACVVFSAIFSAWCLWSSSESEAATLESTVFAAAEQPNDTW